jgi:tetratricopeptide (TPR) repeat protein
MNDNPLGYQDLAGSQGEASFGDARSFQLFVESLRALQSYEVDPAPAKLDTAATKLQKCVDTYPADTLPRFYLGMARTLQGDENVDQAIQLFKEIADSGPPSLRRPAQYNLAAAHVEKYTSADFLKAEAILGALTTEIERVDSRREDPPLNALRAQAYVLWAYCVVDGRVLRIAEREPQFVAKFRRGEGAAQDVVGLLQKTDEAARAPGVTAAVRREVEADSWNVKGYLAESKAFGGDAQSKDYAEEAVRAYEHALALRNNWIPALSNLARLYQRTLEDSKKARALWDKVLQLRPDDNYANYMLGKLVEPANLETGSRKEIIEAYRYYRKAAPTIREAAERAAAIKPHLKWWEQ